MALLGPFQRPVALSLRDAPPASPPRAFRLPSPATVRLEDQCGPSDRKRLATARFLLDVVVGAARPTPDIVARVEAGVDENLHVWTPFLSVISRCEFVAALVEGDDAIADVVVDISGDGIAGSCVYLEWRLTGRFVNAGFLNDDVLVEPSGAIVECSGIAIFEFSHGWATRIHCSYDALSLLEQLLVPRTPTGEARHAR